MNKSTGITKIRNSKFSRGVRIFCAILMAFTSMPVPFSNAQTLATLPAPNVVISPGLMYAPVLLTGIQIYPQDPFRLNVLVDTGDSAQDDSALEPQIQKIVKYFLASLTIPTEDLWVNLSPYEKERIIPEAFSLTDMGRDLLAQDYILKQMTAALMYPEDTHGTAFWERVYARAAEKFGTIDIPVNTFNKVWIVPDRATVYQEGTAAFVTESHLKVLLEEDYTSWKNALRSETVVPKDDTFDPQDVIREIIIPELEKEVNEGEYFAPLRQIYHSLILALWFKRTLRESVLGVQYAEQNKIKGIDDADTDSKEKIYQQYLEAFKTGAYNYIKEEYDPLSQQIIPRKYFSGGIEAESANKALKIITNDPAEREKIDQAMITKNKNLREVDIRLDRPRGSGSFTRTKMTLALLAALAGSGVTGYFTTEFGRLLDPVFADSKKQWEPAKVIKSISDARVPVIAPNAQFDGDMNAAFGLLSKAAYEQLRKDGIVIVGVDPAAADAAQRTMYGYYDSAKAENAVFVLQSVDTDPQWRALNYLATVVHEREHVQGAVHLMTGELRASLAELALIAGLQVPAEYKTRHREAVYRYLFSAVSTDPFAPRAPGVEKTFFNALCRAADADVPDGMLRIRKVFSAYGVTFSPTEWAVLEADLWKLREAYPGDMTSVNEVVLRVAETLQKKISQALDVRPITDTEVLKKTDQLGSDKAMLGDGTQDPLGDFHRRENFNVLRRDMVSSGRQRSSAKPPLIRRVLVESQDMPKGNGYRAASTSDSSPVMKRIRNAVLALSVLGVSIVSGADAWFYFAKGDLGSYKNYINPFVHVKTYTISVYQLAMTPTGEIPILGSDDFKETIKQSLSGMPKDIYDAAVRSGIVVVEHTGETAPGDMAGESFFHFTKNNFRSERAARYLYAQLRRYGADGEYPDADGMSRDAIIDGINRMFLSDIPYRIFLGNNTRFSDDTFVRQVVNKVNIRTNGSLLSNMKRGDFDDFRDVLGPEVSDWFKCQVLSTVFDEAFRSVPYTSGQYKLDASEKIIRISPIPTVAGLTARGVFFHELMHLLQDTARAESGVDAATTTYDLFRYEFEAYLAQRISEELTQIDSPQKSSRVDDIYHGMFHESRRGFFNAIAQMGDRLVVKQFVLDVMKILEDHNVILIGEERSRFESDVLSFYQTSQRGTQDEMEKKMVEIKSFVRGKIEESLIFTPSAEQIFGEKGALLDGMITNADGAMLADTKKNEPVGGIDLDERGLALKTEGQSASFASPNFTVDGMPIIEGLTPVVFSIHPVNSLAMFLGQQ